MVCVKDGLAYHWGVVNFCNFIDLGSREVLQLSKYDMTQSNCRVDEVKNSGWGKKCF
jgi:hypothetical protein